jgi:glycosyltransferase involved in cell wall biosynthesis
MRIAIDLQGAQTESRYRGIGRYSLSLALEIVRNRGSHEVIIALNGLFPDTIEPIRAEFDGLLPQENIRVWHAPGPVRVREPDNSLRHKIAERIREAFLASLQPDVIFISSLFEGEVDDGVTSIGVLGLDIPTVVTLYDLIPLNSPETYLKPVPHYEKHYLKMVNYLKNASALVAISEFTAKEAYETLELDPALITNISAACDDLFHRMVISSEDKERVFNKLNITKPFVLYTGGSDARKNLNRLFRAYAEMPKTLRIKHQLIIVGKVDIDALTITAQSAGLDRNEIIFTGYISDYDLALLYNLCTLFVFPSWYEGFGLPTLEAMSCGAPVISSNTSSLPEIIGHTDALFDPYSISKMTNKLVELLSDEELRKSFSNHGMEQARKFSWKKSAQKAISVFEKAGSSTSANSKHLDHDTLLSRLLSSLASIGNIKQHTNEYVSIAHSISISLPPIRQNQLFVDISELAQRDSKTGVQRVTRSILKGLLNNPPAGYTIEPVYATTSTPGYRYARQFIASFLGATPSGHDEYIEYRAGDIFLGVDLQHHTTRVQRPFLSSMHRHGVYVYFVVYDLLPIQFPHYWPTKHKVHEVHAEWISVVSQFDGALCISRAVADELANWHKVNSPERLRPFKISWFHLGADVVNSVPSHGMPDEAEEVLNTINTHPSFLMVGTIEPRKHHTQALKAFEQLWSVGVDANLVIVGKQGWDVECLVQELHNHKELNSRLFWLEGISDEYLEKVYDSSTCLIAASEGEGFGLPLIEAAQHSLPIIARDIPVFREVAGKYAFYFQGNDANSLATAIQDWIALFQLKKHPISDSMPSLTWSESTSQLVAALGIQTSK